VTGARRSEEVEGQGKAERPKGKAPRVRPAPPFDCARPSRGQRGSIVPKSPSLRHIRRTSSAPVVSHRSMEISHALV
jgi:hypothetical protein